MIGFVTFLINLSPVSQGTTLSATVISRTVTPRQIAALSTLAIQPWDGQGRFTLLLIGLDARPGESLRAARGDTLILFSLNPRTKTVTMLSIPRDLYLAIPGESALQKANSAYVIGELRSVDGGATLAALTMQYNLGIKVNGYVAVNFQTVITLVDTVGGIEIDVPYAINDKEYPDMSYGYAPLYISAGKQQMNGDLALKYARTRHQTSDFDRTKRQQQVILALRDRVLKIENFPQFLSRAPSLWSQLEGGFRTNLTFDQWLSLLQYTRGLSLDQIKRGTIDGTYIRAIANPAGEEVVTLDREKIVEMMTQLFGADYTQ
jgi:LCP family protein required for cell wall assembly